MMVTGTQSRLAFAVFAALAIAGFSLVQVAIADATPTWAVLILLAVGSVGSLVWFKDFKLALLGVFLFTLPIDISKALTAEASAYSPALSLFLSDVAFLPLLALWLFDKLFISRSLPYWTPRHWPAVLWTGWLGVSALLSISHTSGFVFLNNLKYLLYLLVIADLVRDPRYLKAALLALAAGIVAQVFMGLLQIVTGSDLQIQGAKNTDLGRLLIFEQAGGTHFRRPSGFLPHPNVYADYMTFVLPPLIALFLLGRRRLGGAWYPVLLLAAGALTALVLSLSRGGWIAFFGAFAFLLGAGWWFGMVRSRQIFGVMLAGVVAVGSIVTVFPEAIYRVTLSDQRSTDSRIAMIEQALLIIGRHPVLGVGLAGYNRAAQTAIPSSFSTLLPAFRDTLLKGVVHNKYLLTFAETGVIGISLFVLFLGRFVLLPFARIRWIDPVQFALVLGLAASVFGQMVFYMFDHFSYDVRLGLLYMTAGIMLGLAHPAIGVQADSRGDTLPAGDIRPGA